MKSLTDNHFAVRRPGRGAFTLIEVMISIALVLLLMYGVSQVFKLSGDAVGANQAVSKIVRDQRAAQAVLSQDFRNCASDSPLFLISSRIGYTGNAANFSNGFRNAEEQRNNGGDDPTYFDNTGHGFLALGTSDRVPRLDRLGFFARGSYRRQTTSDAMTSGLTSGEAYVWYGHVAVPTAGPTPRYPDAQFGGERILGRMAILLRDAPASESPFVGESNKSAPLAPLGYDAQDYSRYTYSDVARVTLDQFRQYLDRAYQPDFTKPPDVTWFRPMEDNGSKIMRYWCNPTLSRPVTPQGVSQSVPYFVGSCTQFIVEYAGDYLNQDPTTGDLKNPGHDITTGSGYDPTKNDVAQLLNTDGSIINGQTDGQIDFVVDKTADATNQAKWVRRIRWYGLPRDVNGDGVININDVIPLADVLDYYKVTVAGGPAVAPWEYDRPTPTMKAQNDVYTNSGNPGNFRYTCAWHNGAPPMIRILIKIDDPTGKLQDGQWYEYVLSR